MEFVSAIDLGSKERMGKSGQLSLFVFVDALGLEIVERHDFFGEHSKTRCSLSTVFGYSSTCDPTILTGKLPREHGHFTFYRYDPENSPFGWYRWLGLFPKWLTNRGRVRARLSRLLKRVHGFTGYFQLYNMPFDRLHLFDYTEKKNIFEKGGINGGQPTIFDYLREHRIPHFRSESYSERKTIDSLLRAIETGEIVFAYLFLGSLDAVLHAHGTTSPRVPEKLEWYEAELSRILECAHSNYDEVRMFVFSDHGMTDVRKTCDLIERVDSLGLQFGEDYAAVYDSTMARFWFLRDGSRETIVDALEKEKDGRIVPMSDLHEWGCDFPNDVYGELFFLMNPGVLICPSFMGERALAGMHGYDPLHRDSAAAFMSTVDVSPVPRRLDEIYALMLDEAKGASAARRG